MGFLIYILPILIAIGLGVAQFDAGKRQIAHLVELGLGPGHEVRFGDFRGSPFDLRLDDMTIRDAEGVWFDLDDFRFEWTPSALLRGRLVINELSLASLALERLPESEDEAPREKTERRFEIPGLPRPLRGLVIERMAVGELALGERIAGERTVFALDGQLEARDPRQEFALALRLTRQDEPTARLVATAELKPSEEPGGGPPILTVDLEAEETGGLLATVAGAPQGADLTVSLKGTAPVTDWRGRLSGRAGGVGRVDADLGLRAAADLSAFAASADGALDLEPRLLPDGAAPLIEPEARFALRLRRPEEGDRLIVERLAVTTQAATAEATARLDLAEQTTEGRFELHLPRLAALEGLAETPLTGTLTATGRFDGPLDLPNVTMNLTADRLRAAAATAERFTGELRLARLDEASSAEAPPAGLRLDGDGRIEGLAVDGAPPRPPEDVTWALGLDLPGEGAIALRRLTLTGEAAALTAAGRLAGDDFSAEATLDVTDLPRLAGRDLAGLPNAPRLRLQAKGSLAQPLTAAITGRLDRLAPLPPEPAALLGDELGFAADLALAGGTRLTVTDAVIEAAATAATAAATIDLGAERIETASFGLTIPRLAVLAPALGPDAAGAVRLHGQASGAFDDLRVTAELQGQDVALAGFAFDGAAADLRAQGLPAAPAGRIEAALTKAGERLALDTNFALAGDRLRLTELGLRTTGTEATGQVAIDLRAPLAEGALRGRSTDLGPLTAFFGPAVGGRAELELQLAADEAGGQAADLRLSAEDIAAAFGRVRTLRLDADLRNAIREPSGTANLSIAGFRSDAATVAQATLRAEGGLDRATFAIEADGSARAEPFHVAMRGATTALPEAARRLELTELDGRYAAVPLTLRQPAAVRFAADGVRIESLELGVGDGVVRAAGSTGPGAVDLTGRVEDLSLATFAAFGAPDLAGRLDGDLRIAGQPERPEATLDLRAGDVRPGGIEDRTLPPVQLAARVRVAEGRLAGRLAAEGLAPRPTEATLEIPADFSLAPVAFALPPQEAIRGSVSAAVELDRLQPVLAPDGQQIRGLLRLAADIGGTLRVPRVNGEARLADGLYANERTGTVLKDFDIAFRGEGTELVIERFRATDGDGGTVTADGRVDLAPEENLPFEARLALHDATVIRRPAPVPVDGALTLSGTREAVAINGDLSLTEQRVTLTLDARGRPVERAITGELRLDAPELSRLSGLAGVALGGAAHMSAAVEGDLQRLMEVRLEGRFRDFHAATPALAALAGPETTLEATARLAEGAELELSRLVLNGAAIALDATGTADLADRGVSGRFTVALPDLERLSPAAGTPLGGSLRANGTVDGTLDSAILALDATGEGILVRDRRFERVVAEATARGLPGAPEGRLQLRLHQAGQTVEATTGFALADGRLRVPDLELRAPATSVTGALAVDLGSPPLIDGRLQGRSTDLAALMPVIGGEALEGAPLGGRASFEARFSPAEGGSQALSARLRGTDLHGPFGSLGTAETNVRVRDLFADPRGDATVELAALRRPGVVVERLSLRLSGGPQDLTFAAETNGSAPEPFQANVAGGFTATPEGGSRVTLSRLAGSYAREPFRLTEPAALRLLPDGFALDRLELALADGHLSATGRYSPRTVALNARLGGLPLALASRFGAPPLAGRASAELSVTGTPEAPAAELDLALAGLKVEDKDYGDAPPMDVRLQAALRDDRLRAELEASGLFETPATMQASLPLELSLQPFAASMPPDGSIEGRLRVNAELPRVASLLLLDDQRLEGRADLDLGLGGTVANPRVNGRARIADGAYQNLVTGTVLADIQAALTANGTTVTIERFTATDGGRGSVTASGAIDLAAREERFPFTLDLDFRDAVLVRYDNAVAAADGDLAFSGRLGGESLLSGKIAVGPAEIGIPNRLPQSVVDLPVIEIDENGEIVTQSAAGESLIVGDAIRLQLEVTAQRVFVRGRGLESEWQGRLEIAGTVAAPEINGQLQVQRGFVDFVGNRLDLTRGIISFPGTRPPAPNIDVVATADAGDNVTAQLAIQGDATSPELSVSSTPELPEDEILARLLFGRELASITPIQAVQLAAAVNTLRGGGGLDLLGETRALLGVDVIDIRTEQEDAAVEGEEHGRARTMVGVGKYITEDIFVEVERGLTGDSGGVSVEIELTPNVTVDTAVGADARTGVGVKWRYDY